MCQLYCKQIGQHLAYRKHIGGVIVTQDFLDTLNLNGPEHTSLLGTVTALYDVGCFFGAVAAFSIGEMLGRKKSIILGTTVRFSSGRPSVVASINLIT